MVAKPGARQIARSEIERAQNSLGADDVLSIPFEPLELFARIRAQLREKAPDDRLREQTLDARRKETEAEAALAVIVAQKETGKRRWIALGVLTVLTLIAGGIAVRNAQVSRKSTATLALQLENLRSEILTQGQLLDRAQKSREAGNQELTASVSKQLEELRAESAELRKQIATSSGVSLSDLCDRWVSRQEKRCPAQVYGYRREWQSARR